MKPLEEVINSLWKHGNITMNREQRAKLAAQCAAKTEKPAPTILDEVHFKCQEPEEVKSSSCRIEKKAPKRLRKHSRLPDGAVFMFGPYDASTKLWQASLVIRGCRDFHVEVSAVITAFWKLDAMYRAWLQEQEAGK